MSNIIKGGWLAGKKTYITAITGALTAVGAYLYGGLDIGGLIEALFEASAIAGLRAGVAKK